MYRLCSDVTSTHFNVFRMQVINLSTGANLLVEVLSFFFFFFFFFYNIVVVKIVKQFIEFFCKIFAVLTNKCNCNLF
jgi:hypothetical protein